MSGRRAAPDWEPEDDGGPMFAEPRPPKKSWLETIVTRLGGPPPVPEALSRRLDPGTSKAAADSIRGEGASRMALLALDAIREAGERGATCWEIAAAKGLERDSVSPRIPQLVKLGLVYDSGVRRATNGKRSQIVWLASKP